MQSTTIKSAEVWNCFSVRDWKLIAQALGYACGRNANLTDAEQMLYLRDKIEGNVTLKTDDMIERVGGNS